jgi:hypothetical protein
MRAEPQLSVNERRDANLLGRDPADFAVSKHDNRVASPLMILQSLADGSTYCRFDLGRFLGEALKAIRLTVFHRPHFVEFYVRLRAAWS